MNYMIQKSNDTKKKAINLGLFNETHSADIILFVHLNPGCLKTDVYKNVARGSRMGDKLTILQEQGILRVGGGPKFSSLTLTSKGESVALHLMMISEIMGRSEVPP